MLIAISRLMSHQKYSWKPFNRNPSGAFHKCRRRPVRPQIEIPDKNWHVFAGILATTTFTELFLKVSANYLRWLICKRVRINWAANLILFAETSPTISSKAPFPTSSLRSYVWPRLIWSSTNSPERCRHLLERFGSSRQCKPTYKSSSSNVLNKGC